MQVKDLKQDRRNYRKHNQRNLDLIKKSVNEVGFGRSIVVNSENEIICGNGISSTLDKDTKLRVVETDGTELIVVKRNDLKTGDLKQTKLGIFDNSTSDTSEFDIELLQADFDNDLLNNYGIDVYDDEAVCADNVELNKELNDFRGLIYEPTGEKPEIHELYTISDEVLDYSTKIYASNLSDREKEFCIKALTRFYKFNFKKIAECYCHSNDELKKIFEDLVLIIPDGEKLLRNELLKLDNITVELENE